MLTYTHNRPADRSRNRSAARWSWRIGLAPLAFALAAGCAITDTGPRESFDNRDDMEVLYLGAAIINGISDEIAIDVPPGTESMLIEVRGSSGLSLAARASCPVW